MILIIANKIISFGGSSTVKDEVNNDVYIIKGKVLTFTKKKCIKSLDGKVLYTVRNKFFRLFTNSAFIYDKNGNKVLKVTRRFTLKNNFKITGITDNYRIDGDFWGWDFSIYKGKERIGHVGRNLNVFKDSFILQVFDRQEEALLVSFVIAIDNIIDNYQDNHR